MSRPSAHLRLNSHNTWRQHLKHEIGYGRTDEHPSGMAGPELEAFMSWKLHGLLYIDDNHNSHANIKHNSRRNPVEIYVSCASLLQKCCEHNGEEFVLLTNKSEHIASICRDAGLPNLNIKEIEFRKNIPEGIPFYQAHQKLSVFSEFARGDLGKNVALIDIDSIIRQRFSERMPSDALGVYDITTEVPASYIDSLRLLVDPEISIRWYGGEIISGSANLFCRLDATISNLTDSYFGKISEFPHIGDETIVSAAISILRSEGMKVVDLGDLAIVRRWWTSNTTTAQSSFADASRSSVIHLPSDKPLLADLARIDGVAASVVREFRKRIRSKVMVRRISSLVVQLISGKNSHPPRLT